MLTVERLRERLSYDPSTGEFRWNEISVSCGFHASWNSQFAGEIAGTPTHHGYTLIRLDARHYYAHRLAYFYVTGVLPKRVDHKDGDTSNNRFLNLRPATQTQNNGNRKRASINTSGYKGVSVHRCTGKWQARIKIHGKSIWLGTYVDPQDAAEAYARAAKKYFGEFARVE